VNGDVEFKDVVFEYEKNKPVLPASASSEAGNGDRAVGSSGSGKSTVINLSAASTPATSGGC